MTLKFPKVEQLVPMCRVKPVHTLLVLTHAILSTLNHANDTIYEHTDVELHAQAKKATAH